MTQPMMTDDEFVAEAVRRRLAGHTPEQMAAWTVGLLVRDFPEGTFPPKMVREMERDLVACVKNGKNDG